MSKIRSISKIIGIVFFILLTALLLRKLFGGADYSLPTFSSLFEKLSTADKSSIPFIDSVYVVLGDWGVFNFLKSFVSFFIDIFNVLIFVFNGLLSVIKYITWFITWLFIG